MSQRIDKAARKAELAQAVWQVILEQGISAVSIRTVAKQAGLVVGSLRHVFSTRAELIKFSAELMMQHTLDRLQAIPQQDNPEEYALDIIKQLLPLGPDSRAEMEVNTALLAESTALPELVNIRNEAHHNLAQLCIKLVEMLTEVPRNETTVISARRLHALIDGFAFHLLHQSPDADPTWAIDIIRNELEQIRKSWPHPSS